MGCSFSRNSANNDNKEDNDNHHNEPSSVNHDQQQNEEHVKENSENKPKRNIEEFFDKKYDLPYPLHWLPEDIIPSKIPSFWKSLQLYKQRICSRSSPMCHAGYSY